MSIMDMKFGINLPAYGAPVVEMEIDSPLVGKGHREVRINLPLGYERLNYRIFFIDLTTENIIGPFSNGQVVDFSSFSGRVKIKAILDKDYMVSFKDTIKVPMIASGKYVPLGISYEYEGLLDINFYSMALCEHNFNSENALILLAKKNIENVLRASITQIIDQNRTSDGNVMASVFYCLENEVNLFIHENFNANIGNSMSWCTPLSNIKIRNENMDEIMQVINEPVEIARTIQIKDFENVLKMREIALQGDIDIRKEVCHAIEAVGSTGTMTPEQLCKLNTSLQSNNGLMDLVNNTGLNLSMNSNNLGLNLGINSEIPGLNYFKGKK